MKRFAYSIGALALLATSANAADIYGGLKDGPAGVEQVPAYNWTGLYIGGSVGYGNANHDLTVERFNGAYCYDLVTLPASFDPTNKKDIKGSIPGSTNDDLGGIYNPGDAGCQAAANGKAADIFVDPSSKDIANLDGLNSHGIVGDIRLGYDQQIGNRFLVGVFGSYGFSGMETSGNILGDVAGFDIEKGDEWSIGARAGILVNPRTLAYILAAYTATDYEFSGFIGNSSGSTTVDFDGITVGGGVEFALTQNVYLGIEGTHTFYGEETVLSSEPDPVGGFGTRLKDDLSETKVMGTVKVKLNGGLFN